MYHKDPPFLITPMLSVHNDELYLYGKIDWISNKPTRPENSVKNLNNNQHHNKLSSSAKKKAKKAIKYMLYNSGEKKVFNPKFNSSFTFKVGFITLTLPSAQQHTDQEIKSICLNQFLIEASKKWGVNNYIWKAERQGNGNIHFHVLTDCFIPHAELRSVWNRIINKLGYVDRFRDKHHKNSPNSTDIHSLYKIKNIASYITKYMTKDNKHNHIQVSAQKIQYVKRGCKDKISVSSGARVFLGKLMTVGRIWACSKNLSNLEGGRDEMDGLYERELNKIKADRRTKVVVKDYCTMLYFDSKILNEVDCPYLYTLLQQFISTRFDTRARTIVYPPLPNTYNTAS